MLQEFFTVSRQDSSSPYRQSCIRMSMGEFLYRDFEPEARFSLYKKRGVVYTHKFGLPISPIDYENNNVKTIITELDWSEHFVKPEKYKEKKFSLSQYTLEVFRNLNKDRHILASYISSSGEGVRIIFQVDKPIKNDLEYLSNLYYYTNQFKEKYDKDDYLSLDYGCTRDGILSDVNHSVIYWYPPRNKNFICFNKDSKALRKI